MEKIQTRSKHSIPLVKKLVFTIIYAFLLLIIFLLFYKFVFFNPFVNKLRKIQQPAVGELESRKYADLSVIKLVGNIQSDKKSSFVNFKYPKPEGIIRIGCFGDSFTYGSEVDASHDFPSILQGLLHERGYTNVEVINFGNPWHGFHQAYILWDNIGRKLGCDYVILGPSGFHPPRETAFNHTDLISPYYLHARYILDDHDVKLFEVIGDTHRERFNHYFRLFPHLQYLKYDRNTPPFLKCLLPKERTLKNPFYYNKGPDYEEAGEIYEILLGKMLDSGVCILVGHYEDWVVDTAGRLDSPNLSAVKFFKYAAFPYFAFKGHNSPFGNLLVAEQFLSMLIERDEKYLNIFRIRDWESSEINDPSLAKIPLHKFDQIHIDLDGTPMAHFVNAMPGPKVGEGRPSSINGTGIVSLLSIKNEKASVMDSCFIPLDFDLQAEVQVSTRVKSNPDDTEYILGKVRMIDPSINLGFVNIKGMIYSKSGLVFSGNETVPIEQFIGSYIELLVDGMPVMKGKISNNQVIFSPLNDQNLKVIIANDSGLVDIRKLEFSGVFEIVLEHPYNGILKLPLACWRKKDIVIPRPAKRPRFINDLSDKL